MFTKYQSVLATVITLFCLSMGAAMGETGALRVNSQMKTPEGDVRNCASRTAYAIPVSKKSTRVIKQFFDSDRHGYVTIYSTPELIWSAEGSNVDHLRASQKHRLFQTKFLNTHRVECGADGTATFENLQVQDYYLVIPIFWKDESLPRGEYYVAPRNLRSSADHRLRTPANYLGGTLMARITVVGEETQNIVLVNEVGG